MIFLMILNSAGSRGHGTKKPQYPQDHEAPGTLGHGDTKIRSIARVRQFLLKLVEPIPVLPDHALVGRPQGDTLVIPL